MKEKNTSNKEHEKNVCSAVFDIMEKVYKTKVTIIDEPDKKERNKKAVELIINRVDSDMAVEHTRIESYPDQILDDCQFLDLLKPLEDDLNGKLPGPGHYDLAVDIKAVKGVKDADKVRKKIKTWIQQRAQKLKIASSSNKPYHFIEGAPPEVPIKVKLSRWSGNDGQFSISRFSPDDIEKLTQERIHKAFNDKLPKLKDAKGNSKKSALILELNDIALGNYVVIAQSVVAEVHKRQQDEIPDEIYLIRTELEEWQVWVLKKGFDEFPKVLSAGPHYIKKRSKVLGISFSEFERVISRISFYKDGDPREKEYWAVFKDIFPNCEEFWRLFIFPGSNFFIYKVLGKPMSPNDFHKCEASIKDDIKQVSAIHYSIFTHLTYAFGHIQNPISSSFENFYTHLSTVCDLTENLILKIYCIILNIKNDTSQTFQNLSKKDFMKKAGDWYDKKYAKAFETYCETGKYSPLYLPSRSNILKEYFGKKDNHWNRYEEFSKKIREYRNIIVHNALIGKRKIGEQILVPRKECINKYKDYDKVFNVAEEQLKKDFVVSEIQMQEDYFSIQVLLNDLWVKIIDDLKEIFYKEKNEKFLQMYNLKFI